MFHVRSALAALLAAAILIAGCGGGQQTRAHATLAPAPGQSAMGSVHPPGWGTPASPAAPRIGAGAVATAEQYDTITLSTIPHGARFLAGYVDGHWQTANPLAALPWHPRVESIAVFLGDVAACGDFEPGDMTPSQAPAFWRFERAHGVAKPCLYSAWWEYTHEVISDMRAAGIPDGAYWKWDADLRSPRRPGIDSGFDCTQWTFTALGGRNLDESTCTLAFLGVGTVTRRKPQPKPKPAKWSSVEVQVQGTLTACARLGVVRGHWTASPITAPGCAAHSRWRAHSLPFNARPLG